MKLCRPFIVSVFIQPRKQTVCLFSLLRLKNVSPKSTQRPFKVGRKATVSPLKSLILSPHFISSPALCHPHHPHHTQPHAHDNLLGSNWELRIFFPPLSVSLSLSPSLSLLFPPLPSLPLRGACAVGSVLVSVRSSCSGLVKFQHGSGRGQCFLR